MLKSLVKQKIKPLWASVANNSQNSLKNRLLKSAAGSFGLQIAASGLAFAISIMFARLLGSQGLGTYAYATTWANLLAIPATLGIDNLLVREIAIYQTRSRWGLMGGMLRWSNRLVLVTATVLAFIAAGIAWGLKGSSEPTLTTAIFLALVTLPIAALRNLRLAAMKGLHRIVLGQMPEMLFSPLLLIILTAGLYLLLPQYFSVEGILIIKIVVVIVTFVIGAVWLMRSLPPEAKNVAPQYQTEQWIRSALPFMFLGTIQLINSRIDILMLGAIDGVKAVGIYAVIAGITQLVTFIHYSANSVLAPNIASLYAEGRIEQLQRMISKSIGLVFIVAAIISSILIASSYWVLLIFGAEFTPGQTAMNILIVGQLFNAMTGPVGLLLNMTGHERSTAVIVACSALLNIVLNTLLIPEWGVNGAALATTISIIVVNILYILLIKRKLNISFMIWDIVKF
jgi:O-antigen/teichoic acid export membrane protein